MSGLLIGGRCLALRRGARVFCRWTRECHLMVVSVLLSALRRTTPPGARHHLRPLQPDDSVSSDACHAEGL